MDGDGPVTSADRVDLPTYLRRYALMIDLRQQRRGVTHWYKPLPFLRPRLGVDRRWMVLVIRESRPCKHDWWQPEGVFTARECRRCKAAPNARGDR